MDPALPYIYGLPQLLFLAVAIAVALIAATTYWRRHRPSPLIAAQRVAAPEGIIYRDAPTVRVVDSQRIDRIRKVVRLAGGEHADIVETRPGLPPRFRVKLRRLVACEDGPVEQIAVDFGGAAVSCGPLVEEIAFNEFVLARATRDEPRNCVFHYQESGDTLHFMRIKLRMIDIAAGWADIDVMQVSGHWPMPDAARSGPQ